MITTGAKSPVAVASPPSQTAEKHALARYLAEHRVTKYLKYKGLTDAQLQGAEFAATPDGLNFRLWPIRATEAWPAKLKKAQRVWCLLRWLTLDDPPPSPDRHTAWDFIHDYVLDEIDTSRQVTQQTSAGGKKGGAVRAKRNEKRDQAILKARAEGATPTQIASSEIIFGPLPKRAEKALKNRAKIARRVLANNT